MNANKQDVGGLPPLPNAADLSPTCEFLYTAAQMRAYGELCRAAPAGGGCQHEWQPDADVMNARYCPKCDVTQTIAAQRKEGE